MAAAPYKWLTPVQYDLTDCQDMLAAINRKEWPAGKKNLYAHYYISQRQKYEQENRLKDFPLDARDIKGWRKQSSFKKFLETYLQEEKDKFRIASMVSCIAATLVFFFFKAFWVQEYVIAFSADALVGAAALVILVLQERIKYREVRMYGSLNYYIYTDLLSLVLCLMLKTMMEANMDFSLFILLMNYFFQKKRFFKTLDQFQAEN